MGTDKPYLTDGMERVVRCSGFWCHYQDIAVIHWLVHDYPSQRFYTDIMLMCLKNVLSPNSRAPGSVTTKAGFINNQGRHSIVSPQAQCYPLTAVGSNKPYKRATSANLLNWPIRTQLNKSWKLRFTHTFTWKTWMIPNAIFCMIASVW